MIRSESLTRVSCEEDCSTTSPFAGASGAEQYLGLSTRPVRATNPLTLTLSREGRGD